MPIASVNGINIFYEVQGQGKPLVLVGAISVRGNNWKYQTAVLAKHYQIITFHNRGTGKSDKPPGPYTIKMMADDVIGLLDHLQIKQAHVLGVSMGGMIAQEIALNHPERVEKLILGCTYACHDNESNGMTPEMVAASKLPIRRALGQLLDLSINKFWLRILFLPLVKFQAMRMTDPEAKGLEAQRDAGLAHDALARLSQTTAPTLVLAGTKDRVLKPSSSEVIAGRIPGAKLVKVEGGSHFLRMEMKEAFNKEVLNFLEGE